MPAKRYFKIDQEEFYNILLEEDKNLTDSTTCSQESKEQDVNLVEEANKKPETKPKKKSNKEQCIDTTFEVIQDYELAEYINSYLVDQQLYKSINSTQWRMRLESIIKYSKGSKDLAKEIVNQTWKKGYRDFYPVNTLPTPPKPAYTSITRNEVTNQTPQINEDIVF